MTSSLNDPESDQNRNIVSEAFRDSGAPLNSDLYNFMHGIKSVNPGVSSAPANRDSTGYTLFTKPVLNLTYDNINLIRKLEFLGDEDPLGMACAIKCALSPYGIHVSVPQDNSARNIRSRIEDDKSAFISCLSNGLISLSGWPDKTLDTYTSAEGIAKEVISMVDGRVDQYGSYDLSADFRNVRGDVIPTLISAWVEYMGRVAEGTISPYPVMIAENEIDYMTRIYRIVMDESDNYVTKIGSCGGAFPIAVPNAAAFNVDRNRVISDANTQVSLPFKCIGFEDNDPILIKEFNEVVEMFNIDMREEYREDRMIPMIGRYAEFRKALDHNFYPRIESDHRLVWYAPKTLFDRLFPGET